MSKLWLVRHGPTHAKTMVGWTDLPADLSDIERLAKLRRSLPMAPVISSDLCRAMQTAEAIRDGRAALAPDPGLREMHFGRWENLTWQQAETRDPAIARDLWERPGELAPPGGESWHEVCTRVRAAVARHADEPELIIVAHFGAILAILQSCAGWSTKHALSHSVPPLSLCLATWPKGTVQVDVNL